MRHMYSREELAWAAGLFEGEGCFSTSSKTTRTLRAILGSTDLDVLETFRRVIGFGTIRCKKVPIGHKAAWVWQVSSFEQVQALAALLWRYLHKRRKHRISELLCWFHNQEANNLKLKRVILPLVRKELLNGALTQVEIARKFNISKTSVHRIKYSLRAA